MLPHPFSPPRPVPLATRPRRHAAALSLWLLALPLSAAPIPGWIGTYTTQNQRDTGSSGIYSFQWDSTLGTVSALTASATTPNPSFLALHPNGRFLYAVNEESSATGSDHVTAFALDPLHPGAPLRRINSVASQGVAPCYLRVDPSGHWLFVANYTSGTIAVFRIAPDGSLSLSQNLQQLGAGPAARQKSAHAHEVVLSPDGRFLLGVDLGADRIFVYRFNATTGTLTPNEPASLALPPGYGPRHVLFAHDGRLAYLVTELTPSVVTLHWDARRGILSQLAVSSSLPAQFQGARSAAEIALHPNGRFLYVSNRGDSNTIAIFRLDRHGIPSATGHVATGGTNPRFITFDPSGKFLLAANQDSNDLFVFRVDPLSGALTQSGDRIAVPAPVDVVFAGAAAAH